MNPIKIKDICKDIHYLNTTKLKQWQNPQEGNTCNFKILNTQSSDTPILKAPQRFYRCYTFISGEWCYQGVFEGTDRFTRENIITLI